MTQQIAPLSTSSMMAYRPSLLLLRNVHFLPLVHQDWREYSKTLVLPVHVPDTRVVHLELVHSMDIDDFITCFKRFKNLRRKVVQLRWVVKMSCVKVSKNGTSIRLSANSFNEDVNGKRK